MKLHQLDIVAFGPFAAPVSVDFDALSQAGLFLLTGDTGAGKSSVLDAVCFALYGDVPGDRSLARRLRSDHAAPDVAPEVRLEFSARGRRFAIVRSPSWTRPKRRGDGTTQVPARVVCSELIGGEWHPVSHRIDEVGHLLRRLLGLTMTQFVQVAMLPQGQFQAFLRATSDERHRLLQQLFQTERYERIEAWLREHRRELGRTSGEHQAHLAALLHRTCEGADTELPAAWQNSDAEAQQWVRSGQVHVWFSELNQRLEAASGEAAIEQSTAAAAVAEATAAVAQLQARAELRQIGQAARDRLQQAEAEAPALQRDRDRADAAQRSALLEPWRDALSERLRDQQRATTEFNAALAAVGGELGATVDARHLDAVAEAVSARLTELRALVPVSQRYRDLERRHSLSLQEQSELARRLDAARRACSDAPAQLAQAQSEARAAREAALALPSAEQALQTQRARVDAHRRAEQLETRLSVATAELAEAKAHLLAHREAWLKVREERLDGMAAEMASGLAAGCACPVCGSAQHPHPAQPRVAAPDRAAEKAARALVDDAEILVQACSDHVTGLSAQLTLERAAVGDVTDLPDAAALRAASADVATLRACADTLHQAEEHAQRQRDALSALTATVHELETAHAASGSRSALLLNEREDAARLLCAVLSHPERLNDVLESCGVLLELCRSALQSHRKTEDAHDAAREVSVSADAHARAQGFHDLHDAEAAVMSTGEIEALQSRLADVDRACRHAREVLQRPDVAAALAAPAPDLEAARARADSAHQHASLAASSFDRLTRALSRTRELAAEADERVARWRPVLEDLDVTTSLTAFVEGKSADNPFAMRLSAFVLGHRLAQVVAAANQRLGPMTDQRFALAHTGQRGAGERRGGLSLAVHDEWTGETRDPTTLSGGETFVVSLALALGLADVIAHEAGGADLETLFVDEGFGSLDSETLDHVLDVLDSLREGGRSVGVVSHVAEMRDRITARLHVHKSRSGSTLSLSCS